MQDARRIDSGDRALVQIVDAALAEAVRKSGPRLACRPGCNECCMGPFPVTQLDARRLRRGLDELAASDSVRAGRVRLRAQQAVARGPGESADDEPCPALDPATGWCDLYAPRPITCRTFGPPMRSEDGPVGLCELCFVGASDEEIAACATETGAEPLESSLLSDLEDAGFAGDTTVASALASAAGE